MYLYLINYAKSKPELVIMVINTFRKDTIDPNPLIRALAMRTMGCIRVDKMSEYLVDPLNKCLADSDPYVRKTAAICVAKFFDLSPSACAENDFIEKLLKLVKDSNPTVVANAISALTEIASKIAGKFFLFKNSKTAPTPAVSVLEIDSKIVAKLLVALNECSEWCQIAILDFLVVYKDLLTKRAALSPKSSSSRKQSENIIDRVLPRLQHANAAVVLSAVKVMMNYFDLLKDEKKVEGYLKKLRPSIITLLSISDQPELQFVVLKNVQLLVQKYPHMLENESKSFFCRHTDPGYVKKIKLELLTNSVTESNFDMILSELHEYSTDYIDIDVELSKQSIRAIGRIAISLGATEDGLKLVSKCVDVVSKLIKGGNTVIVEETIIIIKDICRKYRNRYEHIISLLCEHLEELTNTESKASFIYLLGEFAGLIENAFELLSGFVEGDEDEVHDSFLTEVGSVQLQILTAAVKILLQSPSPSLDASSYPESYAQLSVTLNDVDIPEEEKVSTFVKYLLHCCKFKVEDPDIRDRGYFYDRLLFGTGNAEHAKTIIIGNSQKYEIIDDSHKYEAKQLNGLLQKVGEIGSVLRQTSSRTFREQPGPSADEFTSNEVTDDGPNLLGLVESSDLQPLSTKDDLDDFLNFDAGVDAGNKSEENIPGLVMYLAADENSGFGMSAKLDIGTSGAVELVAKFENLSNATFKQILIQFNRNDYGLTPETKTLTLDPPISKSLLH